jgi:hypothetical protein
MMVQKSEESDKLFIPALTIENSRSFHISTLHWPHLVTAVIPQNRQTRETEKRFDESMAH